MIIFNHVKNKVVSVWMPAWRFVFRGSIFAQVQICDILSPFLLSHESLSVVYTALDIPEWALCILLHAKDTDDGVRCCHCKTSVSLCFKMYPVLLVTVSCRERLFTWWTLQSLQIKTSFAAFAVRILWNINVCWWRQVNRDRQLCENTTYKV